MKIDASELGRAIALAASVAPTSPTMVILGCVRLAAAKGRLEALCTSLFVQVVAEAGCEGDLAPCVVSAHDLARLASVLPDQAVELELGEDVLRVQWPGGSQELPTAPVDDFPPRMEVGEGAVELMRMQAARLGGALDQVASSACADESRSHLYGVAFIRGKGASHAELVATDGHRLAVLRQDVQAGEPYRELLPTPALKAVRRALAASDDQAEAVVRAGGERVSVQTQVAEVCAVSQDGEAFPAHDRVMPKGEPDASYQVDRRALLRALSRVRLCASGKGPGVDIDAREDELVLHESDGSRRASETVAAAGAGLAGAPLETRAAVAYLADLLKAAPADEIELAFRGPLDPIVLSAGEWTAVLMPQRREGAS